MTTKSETGLILAPHGRDAAVAAAMLAEKGLESHICPDLAAFANALEAGAAFGLVTEEAIATADISPVTRWLGAQAQWSDFPFILLTHRGGGIERNPTATRYLTALGNVTFLERPFHPLTLISVAEAALRARRRQYDARKKLEAIALGQQRLTVALAAGGLGDWSLDASTFELTASNDCKAHYGRAPGDSFTYTELRDAVHPDDAARMQAAVAHSQATGDDYNIEYRCVWPDGSVHWVAVNGRVEYDRYGRMQRMVGVSRDITEAQAAEAALITLNNELESRVEERTRENERVMAQLHEAQKLETLGQLTGGVAHDFNNLLTPIMGTLDLLRKRLGDDDRYAAWIENALQSADRARTLVKRLLGFARRSELRRAAVDIGELIAGMDDLVRSSVGGTVEVEFDIAPDLPAAIADASQLELALLNLCVNARDAMPDGGRLMIAVQAKAAGPVVPAGLEGDRFVLIRVIDTGTGMSPETLQRAIEPFYSTKDVGRGTGLGLSMVHGLAAQLGGAFELRSTLGCGTEARFWLQVTNEPAAERAHVPRTPREDAPAPALSILLVDDEPLVRMGTAAMLRELGHEVQEAMNGDDALGRIAKGLSPDLVMTDYKMPGMDGAELAARLRTEAPNLPVMLITGFASNDDAAAGLPRLTKPFGQGELAQAVASTMAAAREGAPA